MTGQRRLRSLAAWLLAVASINLTIQTTVTAQEPAPRDGRAVIVIGLPGDKPHRQKFASAALTYHRWLTTAAGFNPDQVLILGDDCGSKDLKPLIQETAERESLEKTFKDVSGALAEEDRFWLIVLGHGNTDSRGRAYLHLPGTDLDDRQWQSLLKGIRCREQVTWCTFSGSGWFLKSLSAAGRVVITATEPDAEFNATEFPMALADAMERPVAEVDANKDGRVSVLELFQKSVAGVTALFEADKRLATEHALLDDNGDGKGTEAAGLDDKAADGKRAAEVLLP